MGVCNSALQRLLDLGVRDLDGWHDALAHDLAPGKAGLDEIAIDLPVDPALRQFGHELVGAHVRASGEFGQPFGQAAVADGDAQLARGVHLQPVVDQQLQGVFGRRVGRPQQLHEAQALVQLVLGDGLLIDIDDGGERPCGGCRQRSCRPEVPR